jgi:hypothetical protein
LASSPQPCAESAAAGTIAHTQLTGMAAHTISPGHNHSRIAKTKRLPHRN